VVKIKQTETSLSIAHHCVNVYAASQKPAFGSI